MSDLTRRDLLKLVPAGLLSVSAALGLAALFRFLDYQSDPPAKTAFDVGPAGNYPAGSRTPIPDIPALLIHGPNGFSALSLVCTHLGCTVEQMNQGFTCPCHGSQYDPGGKVLRGPAQKPLRWLRVETDARGHILVHTD